MPVTATTLIVAAMSGAIAGLAGAIEVAGRTAYVTLDMSPGYGYSGIVIAMLAGLNPLGVVAASIFVAGVLVGADSMSRGVAGADVHRRRDRRDRAPLDARRDRVRALPAAVDVMLGRSRHAQPDFWVAVLRIATPLVFGTLGVLLRERAGVLNLGIGGIMVAGALTGWLTVYLGAGSGWACWWRRSRARRSACCTRCSRCRSRCRSTSRARHHAVRRRCHYYAYRVSFPQR